MGYRDYSTAKGHIVDATGHGDFTTISAAIAAASSGQTIFIRPGTYTEDFTLPPEINLCGFGCDGFTPNVIIAGKISCSGTGVNTLSGLMLSNSGDYSLEVTGSSATEINILQCFITCLDHTAINLTSTSASSFINILYSYGDTKTTGITYFDFTGNGIITIVYSFLANNGATSTASTNSSGILSMFDSTLGVPLNISSNSSNALVATRCTFDTQISNSTTITQSGTGLISLFQTTLSSGTASCMSIGAGSTASTTFITALSSNAFVFTGAGNWFYAFIAFTDSNGHNVTSETAYSTL